MWPRYELVPVSGSMLQILTLHVKDPGKQADHKQEAHGAHEHRELIPRAPGLPVNGGRSAETVHHREVGTASHRGGIHLLRRCHRRRVYSGEIRQIRSSEQQCSRCGALQNRISSI